MLFRRTSRSIIDWLSDTYAHFQRLSHEKFSRKQKKNKRRCRCAGQWPCRKMKADHLLWITDGTFPLVLMNCLLVCLSFIARWQKSTREWEWEREGEWEGDRRKSELRSYPIDYIIFWKKKANQFSLLLLLSGISRKREDDILINDSVQVSPLYFYSVKTNCWMNTHSHWWSIKSMFNKDFSDDFFSSKFSANDCVIVANSVEHSRFIKNDQYFSLVDCLRKREDVSLLSSFDFFDRNNIDHSFVTLSPNGKKFFLLFVSHFGLPLIDRKEIILQSMI